MGVANTSQRPPEAARNEQRLDTWHISARALSPQVSSEVRAWGNRSRYDLKTEAVQWSLDLTPGTIKVRHEVLPPEEQLGLKGYGRPYKAPPPVPLTTEKLQQLVTERDVLQIFFDELDADAKSAEEAEERARSRERLADLQRYIERAEKQRRGKVTAWSPTSRRRMIQALSSVAWEGQNWAMLTLTYPGDWESVAGSPDQVKAHIRAFRERWQRKWDVKIEAVWKQEFQRRGAPHFHVLIRLPSGVGLRRINTETKQMWWEIVGSEDDAHRTRGAFFSAEFRKFNGPEAIGRYFSKHGLWEDKEYQHDVPEEWVTRDRGTGRWWGIWGLERPLETIEISEDEAVMVRRLVRRWLKSQQWWDKNPRKAQDGTLIKQRRHRRLRSFEGALGGGWMAHKDAPAFLAEIRRLIEYDRYGTPMGALPNLP